VRVQETAPAWTREVACWICGEEDLRQTATLVFDLGAYRAQDPELAALTGSRLTLNRCTACGFAQPAALPVLDGYFDRMYDQRWSDEWIRAEHDSTVKDLIFARILADLARRLPPTRRTLLDVGAHAGRFIGLARHAGWEAEGLELNPRTATFAARTTGARVRQLNIQALGTSDQRFDAITLTDVLEHVPHPRRVLRQIVQLLAPGGWLAVKVPSGPAQVTKERWRGRLVPGYRPTVADNLVHVSHFSARSLRRALDDAGFVDVAIEPAAPELPAGSSVSKFASRALRLATFRAARLVPRGTDSPLCLNLQAYARAR
jgi:SAM-dependent methyltransferase